MSVSLFTLPSLESYMPRMFRHTKTSQKKAHTPDTALPSPDAMLHMLAATEQPLPAVGKNGRGSGNSDGTDEAKGRALADTPVVTACGVGSTKQSRGHPTKGGVESRGRMVAHAGNDEFQFQSKKPRVRRRLNSIDVKIERKKRRAQEVQQRMSMTCCPCLCRSTHHAGYTDRRVA